MKNEEFKITVDQFHSLFKKQTRVLSYRHNNRKLICMRDPKNLLYGEYDNHQHRVYIHEIDDHNTKSTIKIFIHYRTRFNCLITRERELLISIVSSKKETIKLLIENDEEKSKILNIDFKSMEDNNYIIDMESILNQI